MGTALNGFTASSVELSIGPGKLECLPREMPLLPLPRLEESPVSVKLHVDSVRLLEKQLSSQIASSAFSIGRVIDLQYEQGDT